MIAEGWSLALVAWCLSALALAFGAYMGLYALIKPRWVQKLVRLQPDEQGGGFAEFRATYSGIFFATHFVALAFSVRWILAGGALVGVAATGACAVISALWGGLAFGRLIAMWRDGVRTGFNVFSTCFEGGMALVTAGPWLIWLLG
jgi:hypothetical protein